MTIQVTAVVAVCDKCGTISDPLSPGAYVGGTVTAATYPDGWLQNVSSQLADLCPTCAALSVNEIFTL